MTLNQIAKFEKTYNISINVFGYNYETKKIIGPLHKTKTELDGNHVNLLLLEDGESSHYTLLKSKSRLLSSQKSKHKRKNKFICNIVLYIFIE
jgi:hypothetical protein